MRMAHVKVTKFAEAMTTHRLFFSREAGIESPSCHAVAITPVGTPRSVVINLLYPKPETIVEANVMRPPFGTFCAMAKIASLDKGQSHALNTSERILTDRFEDP